MVGRSRTRIAWGSETVMITGTGSLSTAIAHALIASTNASLNLAIVSRESARLRWLATSCKACANLVGADSRVQAIPVSWENDDALSRVIRRVHPAVVIHTASLQSAWSLSANDDWSRLVRAAGYGITLPLQLVLAFRIARALAQESPDTVLINSCYPDGANPILAAAGANVLCGIGNVATIAAVMVDDLCTRGQTLRIIAHHSHLAAALSKRAIHSTTVMAWRDEEAIHEKAMQWIATASLPTDDRLNLITAATAVRLLRAWLGITVAQRGHLPGVLGLPGGYPVLITCGALKLDLPPVIDRVDAIALNMKAAEEDGIVVDARGVATFTAKARAAAQNFAHAGEVLTSRVNSDNVEDLARALQTLRSSLGAR
jgi:hypothetical protein